MSAVLVPATRENLVRGTQVVCVPDHIQARYRQEDGSLPELETLKDDKVEFGFVTSVGRDGPFCRYWRGRFGELRTKHNSELTFWRNVFVYRSRPQIQVDVTLGKFC